MRDANLRPLFHQNLRKMDWQAIETGGVSRGVPDSNYCYQGIEGWIEFKNASLYQISLRPEQVGWMISRVRHGGIVRIAVRMMLHDQDLLIMFDGKMAEQFRTKNVMENFEFGINYWSGGPRNWNWDEVMQTLITRTPR